MSDWPDNLRIRPIQTWPGQRTRFRQNSPFSSSLGASLDTLRRELRMLRAADVWLEVAISERDFRHGPPAGGDPAAFADVQSARERGEAT